MITAVVVSTPHSERLRFFAGTAAPKFVASASNLTVKRFRELTQNELEDVHFENFSEVVHRLQLNPSHRTVHELIPFEKHPQVSF